MSTKNPLTPDGIEWATFRFVAQHLNHCATPAMHRREDHEVHKGHVMALEKKSLCIGLLLPTSYLTKIPLASSPFWFKCVHLLFYTYHLPLVNYAIWSVLQLNYRLPKNKIQLDATYYFIMLMLGSTCFGHHYAHRQELTTWVVLQPTVMKLIHPTCT